MDSLVFLIVRLSLLTGMLISLAFARISAWICGTLLIEPKEDSSWRKSANAELATFTGTILYRAYPITARRTSQTMHPKLAAPRMPRVHLMGPPWSCDAILTGDGSPDREKRA